MRPRRRLLTFRVKVGGKGSVVHRMRAETGATSPSPRSAMGGILPQQMNFTSF